MRTILALLLILEALSSGLRATGRLPMLVIYPWFTLALMTARLGVAVAQFSSGWMLLQHQPVGRVLGFWSYIASAALVTLEVGLRLTPSNLFPAYRWPAVGLYWLYALAGGWYLRSRLRQ